MFRWAGESAGTQRFHFLPFRNAIGQTAMIDEAGPTGNRVSICDIPDGDYFWRAGVVQYLE